jgi:hypothetical protein
LDEVMRSLEESQLVIERQRLPAFRELHVCR